mmetsp:Transcript_92526/g.205623  ORF Transcript_92526/g.205623 Transcript_92526/m.205623 type:complete len:752 (-) Transcript_92526:82-2337(-)
MGNCHGRDVFEEAPIDDDPESVFSYAGPGPWYKCLPNEVVPPRVAKAGISAETEPATLPALLAEAAEKNGEESIFKIERPCPQVEDGQPPPPALDEWTEWSYEELLDDCRNAGKGFVKLGFEMYDSVNVWGYNSPEWIIAALSASFAGGKVAGIYPTDTPDTAAYKVAHSGGSIIVIEDRSKMEKLAKALAARGDARRVKAFVAYGFEPKEGEMVSISSASSASTAPAGLAVPVLSWEALVDLGSEQGSDEELDRRIAATQPGNCAALIYTSGTTGDPKAVMVSHDNLIYECAAVMSTITLQTQERTLSYLPLSHIAGFMLDIVAPVYIGARTEAYHTLYFARSYDLKLGSIKDRLSVCRPTIFLGVPLVWEKMADKLRALSAQTTGVKKKLVTWAKDLSLETAESCQLGGDGAYPCGYRLAQVLILDKIKGALGLDQCRLGLTGAAPIRVDTLRYFASLDLSINEVYGMSECTACTTISSAQAHEWGSVGYQLPATEIGAFIVDPTDPNKKVLCPRAPDLDSQEEEFQGELCFRGRHVMMGYMAQQDFGPAHVQEMMKKNAETIDAEGWLHSGDKGMVTEAGMVKITGRYKELIIGEGGENIAPVPIEDHVKKSCDGINEIMMVGDHRKYNIALVTLKAVGAAGETPGTDKLDAGAKTVNPEVKTISAALDDKVWIDTVTKAINSANSNTKICPNNTFKIQKFTILPTNFSEEQNELTPTKKLKRKVVETKYHDLIEKIYAASGTYVRYS